MTEETSDHSREIHNRPTNKPDQVRNKFDPLAFLRRRRQVAVGSSADFDNSRQSEVIPVTLPVEASTPPEWESPEQAIEQVVASVADVIARRDEYYNKRQAYERTMQFNRHLQGKVPFPEREYEEVEGYKALRDTFEQIREQFGDFCATVGEGDDRSVIVRMPHLSEPTTPLYRQDSTVRSLGGSPQVIVGTLQEEQVDYLLVNAAAVSMISCTTASEYVTDEASPAYKDDLGLKATLTRHAEQYGPKVVAVGKAAREMIETAFRTGQVPGENEKVREDYAVAGKRLRDDIIHPSFQSVELDNAAKWRKASNGQQSYDDAWQPFTGVERRDVTSEDLSVIKAMVADSLQQVASR